jgi:AcrR family transcriptional regulator
MNVNRRTRRTPEEARSLVLDTAEQRLAEHGLDGLTIVGVARAAGMSHATVIHHFGSTAGMRRALVDRMSERLISDTMAAMGDDAELESVVRKLFALFSTGGHARLLAWLAIEDEHRALPTDARRERFRALIDSTARRLPSGSRDSARNIVTLVIAAAIGLGIGGEPLMELVGMDAQDREAFPAWLESRIRAGSADLML